MTKIKKTLTVVTMIVAMAVPALADYNVIDTTVTILNGETVNASGEMDMNNGTLDVQVGGVLNAAVEMKSFDGNSHMIVNGTAYIEQMKLYGPGDVIVGNGTDAATLTAKESNVGWKDDVSITVNTGSTLAIIGWEDDWDGFLSIGDGVLYDSYIDLVGGTLKVADHVDTTGYEDNIKGNGELGAWEKNTEPGFLLYTAAVLVPPGAVIMIR